MREREECENPKWRFHNSSFARCINDAKVAVKSILMSYSIRSFVYLRPNERDKYGLCGKIDEGDQKTQDRQEDQPDENGRAFRR